MPSQSTHSLPKDYHFLRSFEHHLRAKILKMVSTHSYWIDRGIDPLRLVSGISAVITERTICSMVDAASDWRLALFMEGQVQAFNEDKAVTTPDRAHVVKLDDIMFMEDLMDAPSRIEAKLRALDFVDFGIAHDTKRIFVDGWCIRQSPSVDLSSFETYLSAFGGMREEWEYRIAGEAWSTVKRFSGAQFVYKGPPSTRMADIAAKDFNSIFNAIPAQKDDDFEIALGRVQRHFESLSREQQANFSKKDMLDVLGIENEWGASEKKKGNKTSDTSRARTMWGIFVSGQTPEIQKDLKRSGPRN
jgi:hypothetical protein